MGAPATHALNNSLKWDIDFQHIVQFDTSGLHGVGLWQGTGESVEQKTSRTVGQRKSLSDQIDDQCVADQAPRIHHFLGLQPQSCASLDGRAQHVAGRNLRDAIFLANKSGLSAFACARCAQQNESHLYPFNKRVSGRLACREPSSL